MQRLADQPSSTTSTPLLAGASTGWSIGMSLFRPPPSRARPLSIVGSKRGQRPLCRSACRGISRHAICACGAFVFLWCLVIAPVINSDRRGSRDHPGPGSDGGATRMMCTTDAGTDQLARLLPPTLFADGFPPARDGGSRRRRRAHSLRSCLARLAGGPLHHRPRMAPWLPHQGGIGVATQPPLPIMVRVRHQTGSWPAAENGALRVSRMPAPPVPAASNSNLCSPSSASAPRLSCQTVSFSGAPMGYCLSNPDD